MLKIEGIHTCAAVYSDTAEPYALAQIKAVCDSETAAGSRICVMPDVHPGKVGPIGLTMTVGSKIMPGLVGIDIGCGISYIRIKDTKVEYRKLDTVIRERIPAGARIRKEPHRFSEEFDYGGLACRKHINEKKAALSLGTLGGGNHFLELDRDGQGNIYAVVHSGSRHIGKEVTEFYLAEGQKRLKDKGLSVPYELTYLEGGLMEDYLHDLAQVRLFASLNREIMLTELEKYMKWKRTGSGESVHNYVDEERILRKGAASAKAGESVIIPINMRDGIILGTGKGNENWNQSAPHGAGRVMKREDVKNTHTVSEYKAAMKGIYSPTIGRETLDEAPFAYRGIEEILAAIGETVTADQIIKPVYNYKAGE